MRKSALLVLGLALALLVVTGCAPASQRSTQSASGQQVFMGASWAESYPDLHSLKNASDLVVLGTFTRATQEPQADSHSPVFTDFDFTVTRILANPKKSGILGNITIHQTGGTVNGLLYQFDSDPLFQVGEQAVLFLRQYAPNQFFVIGGPNGRFEVKNGLVTPAKANRIQFAPRVLETFLADIQNA